VTTETNPKVQSATYNDQYPSLHHGTNTLHISIYSSICCAALVGVSTCDRYEVRRRGSGCPPFDSPSARYEKTDTARKTPVLSVVFTSSDLFPEKRRGDAFGPGAACWDLPTPWVWKGALGIFKHPLHCATVLYPYLPKTALAALANLQSEDLAL
jgi:hypothetical protein